MSKKFEKYLNEGIKKINKFDVVDDDNKLTGETAVEYKLNKNLFAVVYSNGNVMLKISSNYGTSNQTFFTAKTTLNDLKKLKI